MALLARAKRSGFERALFLLVKNFPCFFRQPKCVFRLPEMRCKPKFQSIFKELILFGQFDPMPFFAYSVAMWGEVVPSGKTFPNSKISTRFCYVSRLTRINP